MRFNDFRNLFLISGLFAIIGCSPAAEEAPPTAVSSPSGNITVEFSLTGEGTPSYHVHYGEFDAIEQSTMGFEFKDQPAMQSGFEIMTADVSKISETWEMPWGEQREVLNEYNEMTVNLKEPSSGRELIIYFRAYDDGFAFRYEFPEQEGVDELIIMDENTQFNLSGDHMVWWIPGDWDIYEHLYSTTRFSEIDATTKRDHPNLAQTYIPENAVNTPVTMKADEGYYLSFHEANLTDYSGMTLKIADTEEFMMQSELVGSGVTGYKVKRSLPFATPWRMVQLAERAGDLIESNLVVNLNEPNKLGDVSWFKPMKYSGIWWEMHLTKSTWQLEGGKHGATTENAKRFIDFSAENNIGGVLIEGWNTGWERWIGFPDREGVFDFVTPYSDYDMDEVVRYADEKGVKIIMHHETSAAVRTYDQQLDTAYALMKKYGMNTVKTGYVGPIIPEGEYHHGQYMVNHYRKVLETAAANNIAINAHEPIKDTGLRRTYPNAVSREGLRGQEFNAFSIEGGNPPEHLPIVAFTRMLSGPIDFTPGAFKIKLDPYKPDNMIKTTLAQQLALYVVIYSPVQMACDLVEHYEGKPALQFIRDVGVDWEQSKVLDGEVGDFVTIAREERDTGNWFVGSITDENGRNISVDFNFLEEGVSYEAKIYRDSDDAHWDTNPESLEIEEMTIDSSMSKDFSLAPGGGLAISLIRK